MARRGNAGGVRTAGQTTVHLSTSWTGAQSQRHRWRSTGRPTAPRPWPLRFRFPSRRPFPPSATSQCYCPVAEGDNVASTDSPDVRQPHASTRLRDASGRNLQVPLPRRGQRQVIKPRQDVNDFGSIARGHATDVELLDRRRIEQRHEAVHLTGVRKKMRGKARRKALPELLKSAARQIRPADTATAGRGGGAARRSCHQ